MLSIEVPRGGKEFAELYFGKGNVPVTSAKMKEWIEKYQVNKAAVSQKYTGTHPDTWHMTYWQGGYFLVYFTEDYRIYSLKIENLEFYVRNESSNRFNMGDGWACDILFELNYIIPTNDFQFINWMDVNPFDTK